MMYCHFLHVVSVNSNPPCYDEICLLGASIVLIWNGVKSVTIPIRPKPQNLKPQPQLRDQ